MGEVSLSSSEEPFNELAMDALELKPGLDCPLTKTCVSQLTGHRKPIKALILDQKHGKEAIRIYCSLNQNTGTLNSRLTTPFLSLQSLRSSY